MRLRYNVVGALIAAGWLTAVVAASNACAPARPPSPAQIAEQGDWIEAGGLLRYRDVGQVRCFRISTSDKLSCVQLTGR